MFYSKNPVLQGVNDIFKKYCIHDCRYGFCSCSSDIASPTSDKKPSCTSCKKCGCKPGGSSGPTGPTGPTGARGPTGATGACIL